MIMPENIKFSGIFIMRFIADFASSYFLSCIFILRTKSQHSES